MKRSKQKVSYDPTDPVQFFDMIDEEVLVEMIQYYPAEFYSMCMLVSLDVQMYTEELLNRQNKVRKKKL